MTTDALRIKLKKISNLAGIYIFKEARNKPLYIGKALNLKNRIAHYLKTDDIRLQKMVAAAKKLEYIQTNSDIEALILESQYIKKYKPTFNIMLRDDKQYGFVGFTEEKYPRVFITHQPIKPKHRKLSVKSNKLQTPYSAFYTSYSNFIGPFTDIGALKTTLRYLRQIFPYCTCKQAHHNYCLNYHIGKCLGFCCLKKPTTNPFDKFRVLSLSKDDQQLITYQKNIKAIKTILLGKRVSLVKKLEKKMVALGKQQELEKAIELRKKLEKLKRVFKNARIIQNYPYYDTSKNHSERVLLDLKRTLGLKKIPIRIEGYDVANIQGKYAVGAMVVFTLQYDSGQANWEPDKNEYRKFKIHTKHSPDDTHMLKEILKRRLNHQEWPLPDLILIDGGKAQLNVTHSVTKRVPAIALTKDEKHRGNKIYISGRKSFTPLSQLPTSIKNLLFQIDSEAHRFAIGYYRKLHIKSL